jgi:5-methylcytosine-specific restriction endonuclease McrA
MTKIRDEMVATYPPTLADVPQAVRSRVTNAAKVVDSRSVEGDPNWLRRVRWGHHFGRICIDCGVRMIFSTQQNVDRKIWPILATLDHVHQKCDGGSDRDSNIQVVCQSCNGARQLAHRTQNRCGVARGRARLVAARDLAALRAYEYLFPFALKRAGVEGAKLGAETSYRTLK